MNRKRYCYLFLFALVLSTSARLATAASLPFKGEISGDVVGIPTGEDLTYAVELTGTGRASVLGKFNIIATHTTDGATGVITGGIITFVDKHSNTLTGTYTGQEYYPTDPDVVCVTATLTITGGTGRYVGATGIVPISVVATIQEITEDWVFIETFDGSFDGTITLP